MKTTSCITLFALTLSAVSAERHSLRGNKIPNDAASHSQSVSELLHLPAHHATDSSFNEANAIRYTGEELEIAAESAKNFLEGRGPGMEMTRPQSRKYTDEELEIAAESAKEFLENKNPHTTQPNDDAFEIVREFLESREEGIAKTRPETSEEMTSSSNVNEDTPRPSLRTSKVDTAMV